MAASAFSDQFTIADNRFCAVAIYTSPQVLGFNAPTWGRHGGPLTQDVDATGALVLSRWSIPASGSVLTEATTTIPAQIPADAFVSSAVVDLPFFGWSASSYTGSFPDTAGKLLLIKDATLALSYDVNGIFSAVGVGDSTGGRVLFSALSPLGDTTTDQNGLYAADACNMPAEALGSGTGCNPSSLVHAWGDNSGPIALDSQQNVFVVHASPSAGNQQLRGFRAGDVAKGAAANTGTALFTIDGFGFPLAALAPQGSAPGTVFYQPSSSTTYEAEDVTRQDYAVTQTSLDAVGTPTTALTLTTPGTNVSLFTDDADRLWVAVFDGVGTTYVVIARIPG